MLGSGDLVISKDGISNGCLSGTFDVNMTFMMQTRRRFKNPLRVKLCCKSERWNRGIFHFMHPVAGRGAALLMRPALALWNGLPAGTIRVSPCCRLQLPSILRVSVLTSCRCTDCYRSRIVDSRRPRGDSWCLFVCVRVRRFDRCSYLRLTAPITAAAAAAKTGPSLGPAFLWWTCCFQSSVFS